MNDEEEVDTAVHESYGCFHNSNHSFPAVALDDEDVGAAAAAVAQHNADEEKSSDGSMDDDCTADTDYE